jgi:hypothetical protein
VVEVHVATTSAVMVDFSPAMIFGCPGGGAVGRMMSGGLISSLQPLEKGSEQTSAGSVDRTCEADVGEEMARSSAPCSIQAGRLSPILGQRLMLAFLTEIGCS